MQLRFCADTLLCRHIFMQLRIYTAYAAIFLCSYASIPPMRPLFCAVLSCGRAFALSCFSMRTKPLHSHAFTQLNPLRRHILCGCAFYAAMLLRCTGWKGFSGRTILRGKPQGYLRGWPCPCAALWVSRPSRPAPLPAGRRRWNPGRIFHGWRPWCAPAFPAFPAAG